MSFIYGFIELYDGSKNADGAITWRKSEVLCCIWDGYPDEAIGFLLEDFIKDARKYYQSGLTENWNSLGVGARIVSYKGKVATPKGIAQTCYIDPAYELGLDQCSLWRVFLGPKPGAYEIRGYRVRHDVEKRITTAMVELDWRNWQREYEPGLPANWQKKGDQEQRR